MSKPLPPLPPTTGLHALLIELQKRHNGWYRDMFRDLQAAAAAEAEVRRVDPSPAAAGLTPTEVAMAFVAHNPNRRAAQRDELLDEWLLMHAVRAEHCDAAIAGHEAIKRLVLACGHKSGQSRTVRAALYSLWNGGARSLRDCVTGLDWAIHRDLCAVMLGFGYDGDSLVPPLWEEAIEASFKDAGLWDWFLEEADLNKEGEA